MSYDLYLRSAPCDHCKRPGEEPDLPNPTYNLSPIFDFALTGEDFPDPGTTEAAVVLFREKTERPRGLRVLTGLTGAASLSMLNAALDRMADERLAERFAALEPENGWGTMDGARQVMRELKQAAEDHPGNTWDVH